MKWIRRAFLSIAVLAAALIGAPWLATLADVPYTTQLFAGPTSSPIILTQSGTTNSCYFQEVATAAHSPGPVNAFGSNDGTNYNTPLLIRATDNSLQSQPFTPTNKVNYSITPVGMMFIEIVPDAGWNATTQAANTTGRCSQSISLAQAIAIVTSNLQCSGLATCSPNGPPTPSVYVPSPLPSATGCGHWGTVSWPILNFDTTSCAGGGSGVTLHPTPTPSPGASSSPDNGWASTQYGYFAGPEPSPPAALNKALYNYPGIGCSGQWAGIGTGNGSIAGITDGAFGVFCGSGVEFVVDASGNVGIHNATYSAVYQAVPGGGGSFPTCGTNCDGIYYSGTGCGLVENSGTDVGDLYFYNPSGNRCGLSTNGQNALSATCTDNSSHPVMVSCSGQTQNYGEATCTVAGTTSCTVTKTVRSSARCVVSYESNDTTVALSGLLQPAVHTSSTTLTITMQTVSATGTLAVNYWCP